MTMLAGGTTKFKMELKKSIPKKKLFKQKRERKRLLSSGEAKREKRRKKEINGGDKEGELWVWKRGAS